MKKINIIKTAGVLMLALLLTMRVWAQSTASQQLVVPLSDPGKPYKLNVRLISGGITLTGYEGKEVIIDAQGDDEKRGHVKESGDMKQLIGGGSLNLTAEVNNNQVNVNVRPGKTINLIIKVPQNGASLNLSTINDGNIVVTNVNGELEVSNKNGSIKLNNVSGSVVANTINGDVKVAFKSIDPKAAMAFSTLNGNVDVTFPATLKANVKLKSDRGEIYTDFDVVTVQQKPAVTKSNKAGMYSLKMEDWVYGKVDGGGPEILMKNMNGNIYVRKAK
ncbi:MAG: hypothetical protein JWR38_1208 [Mucilaginibacter sp.]|nr:hypothetical protein [Mucilaginibacter sp.]